MASASININELTDIGLVEYIERPRNRTTPVWEEALAELASRSLSDESIKEMALSINKEIAYEMISTEPISSDGVTMHESNLLTSKEIKEIYLGQLEKYMHYKDQFRFDVWSYAIGGI